MFEGRPVLTSQQNSVQTCCIGCINHRHRGLGSGIRLVIQIGTWSLSTCVEMLERGAVMPGRAIEHHSQAVQCSASNLIVSGTMCLVELNFNAQIRNCENLQ